jgi:hypothetical protein
MTLFTARLLGVSPLVGAAFAARLFPQGQALYGHCLIGALAHVVNGEGRH